MSNEKEGRTISEAEAGALLSHFTRRPQPTRVVWRFALHDDGNPTVATLAAGALFLAAFFFALAYVDQGLTPGVVRCGHVCAVLAVLSVATGLRRTQEGGR